MEEQLVSWLNDAYAMEVGLVPILENHARDAKANPPARTRIERHVEETRDHAARLRTCIEALGGQVSTVRATMSAVIGGVESLATAPFRDELVKNALMDYASEHFEIACYRALIAAAREVDRPDIAQTCEEILAEEEAMAAWLYQQIPVQVRTAMNKGRTAMK